MTSEQLEQLAQRLLDHARLHESLAYQDEEQTQWAEDLKQAAKIAHCVDADIKAIRRGVAAIGVVAKIDGYDVIRRASVLEIIGRHA